MNKQINEYLPQEALVDNNLVEVVDQVDSQE